MANPEAVVPVFRSSNRSINNVVTAFLLKTNKMLLKKNEEYDLRRLSSG